MWCTGCIVIGQMTCWWRSRHVTVTFPFQSFVLTCNCSSCIYSTVKCIACGDFSTSHTHDLKETVVKELKKITLTHKQNIAGTADNHNSYSSFVEVTNTGVSGMHRCGWAAVFGKWAVVWCILETVTTVKRGSKGSDDAGPTVRLAGQQSVNEH